MEWFTNEYLTGETEYVIINFTYLEVISIEVTFTKTSFVES